MTNEQLIARIEKLEKYVEDRKRQQLTLPLDQTSIKILQEHFMYIDGTIQYDAGAGGNPFIEYLVRQGPILASVSPPSLSQYTADPATDYLTIAWGLKFHDGDEVTLFTSGSAPNPLSAGIGTIYHVRDSDGRTFKLAATAGGAAINITTAGIGPQFISY